jgi:hypothetical protein
MVGAANNSGNQVRMEIWSLTAPPVGVNNILIRVSVTSGTVGAVAASAYFAEVDQTTPLEAFGSAKGQGGTEPSVTVSSVAGQDVIDTVATFGNITLTPGSGQIPEWQTSSGGAGTDVTGAGSIKAGATPNVTMQWKRSSSQVWVMGAVSVRPAIKTEIEARGFEAQWSTAGTELHWQTAREVHNLGFNVYREENGRRVRLNPSIIAGSALTFRANLPQHAGKSYSWIDETNVGSAAYWLEDVDINGTRTLNGPVTPKTTTDATSATDSLTLSQLHVDANRSGAWSSHRMQPALPALGNDSQRQEIQYHLAANPAVKILVDHEGWYRMTQPELVAAGLNPSVNPRLLKLYAQGIEQTIRITDATEGSGGFGPNAAIEFYGVGLDTPFSDRRIYWLTVSDSPGKRIILFTGSSERGPQPLSFSDTVELRQRTTYFAALLKPTSDNFFGALVSTTPVDQVLTLPNVAAAQDNAVLEVVLQGVSDGIHEVNVTLNSSTIGTVTFNSQGTGKHGWQVPLSLLQDGPNTVTLTSSAGDTDTSLVNFIRIEYPRKYYAESDSLEFTAHAGDHVVVKGFQTTPTRLFDITDTIAPLAMDFQIESDGSGFTLEAKVPWSSSDTHTLLALADDKLASAITFAPNHPSKWHTAQPGGDVLIITHPAFIGELDPLVQLRRGQGRSVVVVDVDDVFDEFNFGEATPFALRDFLKVASEKWQNKPKYLLLVGDASLDPRNYLGFGYFDFVPTRIISTSELKTASDDWFTDFNDNGVAQIPTGRLPVRTVDDAKTLIGKIVGYDSSEGGDWSTQALMVADQNDPSLDFTQEARSVQALLPPGLNVTDVFAANLDAATARQDIIDGINAGKLLVNYNGHGSVEVWSGEDLFDDTATVSLTNGTHLPVFLIMDCLNGFFQDVYTESLAEALLLTPNGGAVAVWASSALTDAGPQLQVDQALVKALFGPGAVTLGDAILQAKSKVADADVRKTYILFGDPAMRPKNPTPAPVGTH